MRDTTNVSKIVQRFPIILIMGLLLFSLICCSRSDTAKVTGEEPFVLTIPEGFPPPHIPEDNQMTTTRVALGKRLFFDPILSIDSTISCGSCHFQKYAFSDTTAVSQGVNGKKGFRNAPALVNVAYNTSFFHDGGVPTLEMQVLVPIETEEEMKQSFLALVERLKNHPEYPALIRKAYNRDPDIFSVTRSIAAFERTLISGNSRYDQFMYQGKKTLLTPQELAGMELFFGERTNCAQCHSGFNFSNQQVESNGLYEPNETDPGRMRITLRNEDEGKFKVPTLRNIELTAPYMHDGSLNSLDEVIAHYASGGNQHVNKSKLISGFEITEDEKNSLIAFLYTLTDENFITNKAFNP